MRADWLTPGEALRTILGAVAPLAAEERALLDAAGRALADDVTAEVSLPPWDNSAMDGYAARAADVAGAPVTLRVVDEIPAGGFPSRAIGPGEAARIMTGAPVPEGCDTVVRVEHTRSAGDTVHVQTDADAGRNVRSAGEDVRVGDVPLWRGMVLTPPRIAVAASLGRARLRVVRRPVVAVLASGDELVPVERFDEVRAGRRIVSSNGYALAAQLAQIGCEARLLGIARDTPESLRTHLLQARGCDAIITTAGVSVGEHDHVRTVLSDLGAEIDFWRVRARPGSALAFGRVGRVPWFGLPGNPVSTMVSFELFARPALLRMAGHEAVHLPSRTVRLAADYPATGGSTHFVRVRLADGVATVTRSQSSGVATGLAEADALAIVPPGEGRAAGAEVRALILGGAPAVTEPAF